MIKNFENIKENMLQRACELWGIEDPLLIDPVIELLIDVFCYEFSKIDQEIKISDAKLLERLAKILVNEQWSLPSPAHGLLRAIPAKKETIITRDAQFYYQKKLHGEELREIFFTPITSHELIPATIAFDARQMSLTMYDLRKVPQIQIDAKKNKKIPDYTVWIGLDISDRLLQKTEKLTLALTMQDSPLEPLLRLMQVHNNKGELLPSEPAIFHTDRENEFFVPTILEYYKNNLFDVYLPKSKSKTSIKQQFDDVFPDDDIEEIDKELYWLRISLPVAFTNSHLEKLQIALNTFPIVNRNLRYKQHNLLRNGKIVSLPTINEFFLNVETLIDNDGRPYAKTIKNDIQNLKGTYSLYFGELEQFDARNAKSKLEEIIQTVREEGSAFSAIGYDLINAYLDNLNDKLNDLQRKVDMSYEEITDGNNRQYLITIPYDTTETLECNYWTTDAMLANNIKKDSLLRQYHSSEFHNLTVRLQTETFGGTYRHSAKEKISGLRYGLIAKDRIVSVEDVKEFVHLFVGKTVEQVAVKSGVGIGNDPKKGLIRTTQVKVTLTNDNTLTTPNKIKLGNFLQIELEQKSVHNLPYQVTIN